MGQVLSTSLTSPWRTIYSVLELGAVDWWLTPSPTVWFLCRLSFLATGLQLSSNVHKHWGWLQKYLTEFWLTVAQINEWVSQSWEACRNTVLLTQLSRVCPISRGSVKDYVILEINTKQKCMWNKTVTQCPNPTLYQLEMPKHLFRLGNMPSVTFSRKWRSCCRSPEPHQIQLPYLTIVYDTCITSIIISWCFPGELFSTHADNKMYNNVSGILTPSWIY